MGWAQPIFFWGLASLARDRFDMTTLTELLERTLPGLGYELVDVELSPKARQVRVFIDKPGGVDVEDCASVSNHLTRLFAVENIDYERLEVSSPGLDRPLVKAADYVRFAGQEVQVKLREPIDGARKLKGTLRGLAGDAASVETAKGVVTIPLSGIERARLVPKIEWRK
jgi:ribosome maturation factor RimP